ncbi:hypothetical protein [Micromonospora robiginosa]|uniref:Uncharacterized protein n=1 Tax=Micromonospora robiginosa TaxID=2749844 RepID=A0A7L6B7J9_9ACTN|nr:hypothetical protein [Micromonospora ferruginea]QLQ37956.1 hypothetical protein H1D33_03420 [Micromonospora ferruginea]
MTLDLDAIDARVKAHAASIGPGGDKAWNAGLLAADVPKLLAEVRRLRVALAGREPQILAEEPGPGVTEVYDRDGSPWNRDEKGRWCAFGVGAGAPISWQRLTAVWGPITTRPAG